MQPQAARPREEASDNKETSLSETRIDRLQAGKYETTWLHVLGHSPTAAKG